MHPNHVAVIEMVVKVCTDGVDSLCREMETQKAAIVEAARRQAQEEEDRRLEKEKEEQEVERLTARIAQIRGKINVEESVMDDEGEDEMDQGESASDTEQVVHQPVRVLRSINCIY